MEDSAPLPVVYHRVEGGGGHGQQGGDEAVLAQQPQTPRSASSSGSTPSSSSSGQAESKPAPKKRKTWKRQYQVSWTHAHEEGSAKASGVARIAAHSRVQHALAVCRHTRACVRVGPVTEARP